MNKKIAAILAGIMAAVMVLSLLPAGAFAAGAEHAHELTEPLHCNSSLLAYRIGRQIPSNTL